MRLLALASMLMTAACASGPPPVVASPTTQEPRLSVPSLPSGSAQLRYNPARCPCTPWEVKLSSGWERVQLMDGTEDGGLLERLEGQLKAGVDKPAGQSHRALVEALEERKPDGAGHSHGLLLVKGLAVPDEAPPRPQAPQTGTPAGEGALPQTAPPSQTVPEAKIAPAPETKPAPAGEATTP